MRLKSVSGAQKRNNDKQMRAASGRDSGIGVALAAAAISAALTARLMQWYSGRDQKVFLLPLQFPTPSKLKVYLPHDKLVGSSQIS